jgi:hypothetical protein
VNGAALGATLTVAGTGAFTVSGVGTVANAIVTESATATGALTVNTVDTAASTVTQVAGATGAFVLNAADDAAAGTGLVTLTAVSSHASQTINMSAATGTAVLVTVADASTATAYTVNAVGVGGRTYVSDQNTAAVDTFTGGTGVDNVDLGPGADRFTSGGGADVYNVTVATDTGVALGFAASTAVPTTALSTAGMDVITGMSAGMTVVTGLTTASANALIRNGGSMPSAADAANTANALLLGVYDSTANTFTPNNAGSDSLLVVDNNGDTAAGGYNGIVLVGYSDPLQNDTLSAAGVFTSVAG